MTELWLSGNSLLGKVDLELTEICLPSAVIEGVYYHTQQPNMFFHTLLCEHEILGKSEVVLDMLF